MEIVQTGGNVAKRWGMERGPGEAHASAWGVLSEPMTGCLALEALLPETGLLPTQAGGR